jgi:serine/threonine protein kinase
MCYVQGLDYLHSKRLVHFDLKSANLLVTMRDKVPCVKLADMGREWPAASASAADWYTEQTITGLTDCLLRTDGAGAQQRQRAGTVHLLCVVSRLCLACCCSVPAVLAAICLFTHIVHLQNFIIAVFPSLAVRPCSDQAAAADVCVWHQLAAWHSALDRARDCEAPRDRN